MKHTPAPWNVEVWTKNNGQQAENVIVANKQDAVAKTSYLWRPDKDITEARAEEAANARLIAAAPELLEALKTVLQLAEAGVIQRNETGKPQWNLTDELQTIAHAAILKAEG